MIPGMTVADVLEKKDDFLKKGFLSHFLSLPTPPTGRVYTFIRVPKCEPHKLRQNFHVCKYKFALFRRGNIKLCL